MVNVYDRVLVITSSHLGDMEQTQTIVQLPLNPKCDIKLSWL